MPEIIALKSRNKTVRAGKTRAGWHPGTDGDSTQIQYKENAMSLVADLAYETEIAASKKVVQTHMKAGWKHKERGAKAWEDTQKSKADTVARNYCFCQLLWLN